MRKLTLRIISYKQTPESEEYLYALNDNGEPQVNCYYYQRDLGRLACIQRLLEPSQLETVRENKYPIIEATSNGAYVSLPMIPQSFVAQYFETGKQLKEIELRLP